MSSHNFTFGLGDEVVVTVNGKDISGGYVAEASVNGDGNERYYIYFDEADQGIEVAIDRIRLATDDIVNHNDREAEVRRCYQNVVQAGSRVKEENVREGLERVQSAYAKLQAALDALYRPGFPKNEDADTL